MTRALEDAIKEASRLSDADQDALAAAILVEIRSEQAWAGAFETSQEKLDRLADEALEEHRSGRTKPFDPDAL